MNVHVISVVGKFVKMLPFMVAHYKGLGISSFDIHIHATSNDDPVIGEARSVMRKFGLDIGHVHFTPTWIDAQNIMVQGTLPAHPDDWFLIVDQDELQTYPKDIFAILGECEAEGFDHIHGCFVDRFGPGGTLPPLRSDTPVWDQFPLGAFLTHTLLQAYPRKIVATKGSVPNNGSGSHWAEGGTECPIDRYHIPVHHFKWTDGLVQHLKERVDILRRVDNHWRESQRILDHLEQNNGRIDIDDPTLFVAPCNPEYELWDQVTGICALYPRNMSMPDVVFASSDPAAPIRLNSGGVAVGDFAGEMGSRRYPLEHHQSVDLTDVPDAAPESLYRSARLGGFAYALCGLKTCSPYRLRLHFAEMYLSLADERLFDVCINERPYRQKMDVIKEAGGRAKGLVLEAAVVTNRLGQLFIDFFGQLNEDAIISGVELLAPHQDHEERDAGRVPALRAARPKKVSLIEEAPA